MVPERGVKTQPWRAAGSAYHSSRLARVDCDAPLVAALECRLG
jgi:hypothetical protein